MDAAQSIADFSDAEYVGRSVAVKEHIATDDDQLTVRVGDVVYVIEQDSSGWWGGHKEGEDGTGWFPGAILGCPLEPVGAGAAPAAPGAGAAQPAASPARHSPLAEAFGGAAPAACGLGSPAACSSPPPASPGCTWDNRMVASPQRKEEPRGLAGGDAAQDASSMAAYGGSFGPPCAAPPPPRGTHAAEQGAAAVAAVLAGGADADASAGVRAERDRLQADVGALRGELHQLRRQSVADQARIRELEQLLRDQERQLKDYAAAQGSLSAEAAVLRERLESEASSSKAQIMANEQMRQRYEEKLKEKAEDNRRDMETARRSIQAEQQAAQAEQRRVRALEQQLQEARGEVEQLRREREAASAGAGGTEAARAKEEGTRWQGSDVTPGRRHGASPGPTRTAPAPSAELSSPVRGRPLPRPSDQQPTPPQTRPQPRPWLTRTPSAGGPPAEPPAEEEEFPPRGCVLEKVSIFEERCRSQTPVGRDPARARSRSVTEHRPGAPQRSMPGVALAAVQRMRSSPERRSAPLGDGAWAAAAPTAAYLPSRAVAAIPGAIADEETRARGREEPARGAGSIRLPLQATLGHEVSGEQSGEGQPFMGMSPIKKALGSRPSCPGRRSTLPGGAWKAGFFDRRCL